MSWFNGEKGFGFVKLSDGSGDAFLHAKVLEGAGHSTVEPGSTLMVRVGQGQKGMQVTQVTSVDASTATPAPPRRPAGPRPGGGGPRMDDPTQEATGTVKWYDPAKGFGFITLDGGTKDAFVHATALERSGVGVIAEGQRVTVQVAQGVKGPEVRSLRASD